MYRVFIDGSAGTTGLKIHERFAGRPEIEVLEISQELRKDLDARVEMIRQADVSFLCLPDDASREICEKLPAGARVLDTSTAHRTQPGWVYGLPELSPQIRNAIVHADRVAVPGCHATGFLTLAAPLVSLGVVAADYPFTAHSVTGYSGGGKKMIGQYEDPNRPDAYRSPRQYALGQTHKHLPEMQKIAGLAYPPVFNPIVADFFSGMVVSIPLHTRLFLKKLGPADLAEEMANYYAGQRFVTVHPYGETPEDGTLDALALAGTNRLVGIISHVDELKQRIDQQIVVEKSSCGSRVHMEC